MGHEMIIKAPGFYASKAGKCEVVEIRNNHAVGWNALGGGAIWDCETGGFVHRESIIGYSEYHLDITGPYIDPPKPIEAWMVINEPRRGRYLYFDKQSAVCGCGLGGPEDRLVHLREVTEEG